MHTAEPERRDRPKLILVPYAERHVVGPTPRETVIARCSTFPARRRVVLSRHKGVVLVSDPLHTEVPKTSARHAGLDARAAG